MNTLVVQDIIQECAVITGFVGAINTRVNVFRIPTHLSVKAAFVKVCWNPRPKTKQKPNEVRQEMTPD
jgi:hypothetical protein